MNCPICKSKITEIVKKSCKDQYFNIEGEFSIKRCKSCNFIYTSPYITGPELFKYYPDNYAPYNEDNIISNTEKKNTLLQNIRNKVLPNSPHFIPKNLNDNSFILEIGCSHGSFLQNLKEINNTLNLTGIELNKNAADIATKKGFEILNIPFENIVFNKKFDLIFLWMVFEHLPYPDKVVDKFAEITNKDAKIIFSIPELDSIEFFLFGKYAQHVDIPRHLNFFNIEFLTTLFNKRGFKLEKKINIYNPVPFFRSFSIFLENKIHKKNSISIFLNKFENKPFNTLGGKLILYLFGFPFLLLQKFANKTPGAIYVFSKLN